MEEIIETAEGGHYDRCGEMRHTDESNNVPHVKRCDGCGKTNVRASALSKTIFGIGALGATVAFGSIDFVAPPTATTDIAYLISALGPMLGILVLIASVWVLRGFEYGVTVQEGSSDE